MVKIGIILGSTRPGRFGEQPARWLHELTASRDAQYELVDVAAAGLPLLDEPVPPKMKQYANEHTKKWSQTIDQYDGFVFVTAEYNHSVPAALKNAIDYLFYEWNYKPVSFVSYGSAAGGARSVEHWRGIAAELKMFDINEHVMLHNLWGDLNDKGEYQFSDAQASDAQAMLEQLEFWAGVMKPARQQLADK